MSQYTNDVMTARDVAALLCVNTKMVYDAANQNRIPYRRMGRRVLFSHRAVMAWSRHAGEVITMSAYRDKTGRWRFRKWVRLPNGERERICGTPAQNTRRAAEIEERAAIQLAIDAVINPQAAKRKEIPRFKDSTKDGLRDYSDINHRPSTGLHWRNALDRHFMPVFGYLRLNEIGLKLVDQYKRTKHEADLISSTINGHLRTLKRVLTLVRDWEILERVPRIALVKIVDVKVD